MGQASPQPIVMTTSEVSTASRVSSFGRSAEMSMPTVRREVARYE
jgi:hypothetical protein